MIVGDWATEVSEGSTVATRGWSLRRHGPDLALLLGPTLAVVGGVLMTCGGNMLALAMESVLAQEKLDPEASRGSAVDRFHSHDDRVARTP